MTIRICNFCNGLRNPIPVAAGVVLLLGALALPPVVRAIDTATLTLARIEGDGWEARDVHVALALGEIPGSALGVRVTAALFQLEGVTEPLRGVAMECPNLRTEGGRFQCERATISTSLPSLGAQRFRAAVAYDTGTGALDLRVEDLRIGDGTATATAALRGGAWTAEFDLEAVNPAVLLEIAHAWAVPLPAVTAEGTMDLKLAARGTGSTPSSISFQTELTGLTAGNEAGTLASDNLSITAQGELERRGDQWQFSADMTAANGQAYAEPLFLDFGVHAITASATGVWHDEGSLELKRFTVDHSAVLKAQGQATVAFADETVVRELDATIESLQFPGAYASYLQPFLIGTGFQSMETAGTLHGRIVVAENLPQSADLVFERISADDGTGKLALYGLSGALHWASGMDTPVPADSQLTWEGGLLFGLDLGPVTLDFRAQNRDFELLEDVRIPVLDGAIEIDRFRIQEAGTDDMAFALDANVLPISVQRLSRAFGWPEFGGQLEGRISDLRLEERVLTLATTLQARVFDGRLEISDLMIEDPFGDWPRLYSSIDIYNLDLEQVTSAFSFGLITGRLSGYVNELVLFNWMPVEFDLRLYTPPGDRSRRRISQRAVQNIGNIGGGGAGVGAALSSGFMRFFEEFSYAQLGISCRLENEVCLMDGVEPAPNGGYYLVKGRGLPRIDVIGNAGRVDWPRLVAQLGAIAESGGPVVQ